MNKEKISRIISGIDEKYVAEAVLFSSESESGERAASAKRSRRIKIGALAACLALAVAVGFSVYAVAAEAKEYGEAVAFFEENGLSADGLSRAEVKAVYRDITTSSFTYEKTADVIRRAVPGYEIEQDTPTPEALAELWNKNVWIRSVSKSGLDFRFDYEQEKKGGFDVLKKSILECYRDGELIWSADLAGFFAEGYYHTDDATAVWGFNETLSSGDTSYVWLALVDNEGNVTRQIRLSHGFEREQAAAVLPNGDGTWAVISRGDIRYLCLSCLDSEWRELSFNKTEVGNLGIRSAARLGDGYIVQLWNQMSNDTALLYKMDRGGNVTDTFSYEADDCDYYITDLAEFGGQVYLSAYAVPKQKDEGGRHEIANVLNRVFSRSPEGYYGISDEELTPLVQDNYTALLLICDPDGGSPETFYSVKGSLGGKLCADDPDRLEWDVESIVSTFFSPATNSFTIGGTCAVYRYTFDASGALVGQTDTGETVPYRR